MSHLHAVNQEPEDYENLQVIRKGNFNIGVKTFIGIVGTLALGWLGGIVYLIGAIVELVR